MIALRRLLSGELLKLRTTPAAWGLAAGAASLAVCLACARVATSSAAELRGEQGMREVLAPAGAGAAVFALALGLLAAADEYRHGTLVQTLLAARAESQVVAAKVLGCAAGGVALGLLALAPAYAAAAALIASKDAGLSRGAGPALETALGSVAACGLLAAVGGGLGAALVMRLRRRRTLA